MRLGHSILAFGVSLLMACTAVFAAEPIRIGMFAELTGANAESGKESVNGSALAVEEINRAGGVLGRRLEILTEDNESTNPGSEVAMSKLLRGGDVKAIITSPRSTQVQAVMPEIVRAGIPTLVCGTLHELTHANNPWIFRIPAHDGYSTRAMADFGVNALKKKKWAIVYTEESYGIDAKDRLVEELKAFGVAPAIVHGSSRAAQSFTTAVVAIKNADVDIVAVFVARFDAAAQFAKQLREAGVRSVLIGASSLSSTAAMRIAGTAFHDSYSVASYAVEASQQSRAFAERYMKKMGAKPDAYAGWAYDAVHLVAQAIKNAGSTDPDAMRKGLLAIQGWPGAVGAYSFDRNGDGLHGYNIVKNDRGKLVFIRNFSYPPK